MPDKERGGGITGKGSVNSDGQQHKKVQMKPEHWLKADSGTRAQYRVLLLRPVAHWNMLQHEKRLTFKQCKYWKGQTRGMGVEVRFRNTETVALQILIRSFRNSTALQQLIQWILTALTREFPAFWLPIVRSVVVVCCLRISKNYTEYVRKIIPQRRNRRGRWWISNARRKLNQRSKDDSHNYEHNNKDLNRPR